MELETLQKANKLYERIDKLSTMKRELRPKHCNGVGVCGSKKKNDSHTYYQYDMWSTHDSNTEDEDLIMRVAINAMYSKVCDLLESAEADLEALK